MHLQTKGVRLICLASLLDYFHRHSQGSESDAQ